MAAIQPPPLHEANVIVVLNASDRDHFAISGEGAYHAACPDWAELTFIADHDIAHELAGLLEEGSADAVVFASNSLTSSVSQRAIAQPDFVELWRDDGPSGDVGMVVLHQYRRVGEQIDLKFLGSSSLALVGIQPRRVEEDRIGFRDDWPFTDSPADEERARRMRALSRGYGRESHCVWTRFELDYPSQWEALAWEDDEPLVAACPAGNRVVAASRVPLDLTGDVELLGSLLAACLQRRGCLVVESAKTTGSSAFSPSLASAIDRRRFVYRVRPASTAEIDLDRPPYHYFDEVIVAPEWRVDEIESLHEDVVLRKLEQGGSIVASFPGPARRPVAVRLSGQPQYAERANHLARWLLSRLDEFKGDVWSMRALASVVIAIEAAYEDERLVPQALRADYVRRHLGAALEDRVENNNVDEIVLATVAAYSALSALGVGGLEGMRSWIETRIDEEGNDAEVPSVIAQALVLAPELVDQRRAGVHAAMEGPANPADDSRLLGAYAAMLFAADEPQRLAVACADESLGLTVQAELLRTAARTGMLATDEIVALAARVRDQIDRLAAGEGALEAVCIGNAALIELARKQGIGPNAAVRGRPREVDARTVASTELVRDRETAMREAAEARRVGRQATTLVTGMLTLVTVIAILAILVWWDEDLAGKFGFAAGVLALMSPVILYVNKKARDAGIPPWPLKGP